MGAVLADLSEGYERLVDHGHGVETAWYPDGSVGVRHTCDRGPKRGTLIVAPRLVLGQPSGHIILSQDPVTVVPSVGCSDCGLHGFVTDGVWAAC